MRIFIGLQKREELIGSISTTSLTLQLQLPGADIFAIHFANSLCAVHGVHERDEAEASRLVLVLRSNHLQEGIVNIVKGSN